MESFAPLSVFWWRKALWIFWLLLIKRTRNVYTELFKGWKCTVSEIWSFFFLRKFDLFRRCLDAEMKNGVRERLQIMNDKEEKSLWARKKKQHSGRRNFWELLQVVIKHNRFLQRKSLWAAWGRPQRYRGKQLWSWFELHYTSKKPVLMDYCIHVRLYELNGDTRTDDCIYTSNCDFFVIHLAHWNNA